MKVATAPAPSSQASISGGPTAMTVPVKEVIKMNVNRTPGLVPTTLEQEVPAQPADADKAKSVPDDTQPISPQLAALAKRHRAVQARERAVADKEKALTEQAAQPGRVELAKIKSDPLGVLLNDAGLTWDELTQAVLNHQNGTYNPKLAELETKMQTMQQGFEKQLSERDQMALAHELKQIGAEAQSILNSDPNKFEVVRAKPDAMALVREAAFLYYKQTGLRPTAQQTLEAAEETLLQEAIKWAKLKKVQEQIAPVAQTQMPAQTQRQQGMTTLKNTDTAPRPLSAKQRAILAFKGELKQ